MNRFHAFAFLGLVLLPLPLGAQFSWDSSNVGSAFTLNDIVMCSSHSGIAVGDNGTIARTTDGGLTWTRPASGTTNQLMAVTFLDSLNGWLAGSQVFMYTTDGGTTWLPPVETYVRGRRDRIC